MKTASERASVLAEYFGRELSDVSEPVFWEFSVADAVLRAGWELMELDKESFGVKRSDIRFAYSDAVFEIECSVADFPHWPVFSDRKERFVKKVRAGMDDSDFETVKAVFWTSLEKKLLKWQFSDKADFKILAIKVFPWTAVEGDSQKFARKLFSANFSETRSDRWPESLSYKDGTARKIRDSAVSAMFSKLDAVLVSFGEGTKRKNDRHAFLKDSSAILFSEPSETISAFLGNLADSGAGVFRITGRGP